MCIGASAPHRITIAECAICSSLAEVETSFAKYGWDEQARPLPPGAARLERVEEPRSSDEHHVRRCPLCGTYYQYDWSYEYLSNGSEDEEVLTRLTPAQARRFLTGQDYDDLMAWLRSGLQHESALARSYAAKCLVSHHLERHETAPIASYLRHQDPDIVRGALFFLARRVGEGDHLAELSALGPLVAEVLHHRDPDLSARADYVITQLQRRRGSER